MVKRLRQRFPDCLLQLGRGHPDAGGTVNGSLLQRAAYVIAIPYFALARVTGDQGLAVLIDEQSGEQAWRFDRGGPLLALRVGRQARLHLLPGIAVDDGLVLTR